MAVELGNLYKASDTRAYTTAVTLMQLRSHATRPLVVARVQLDTTAIAAASLQIQILRQTTAGTMTTLSPGPLPLHPNTPTAGLTAGRTATVEPTASDIMLEDSFNAVNGFLWLPTPDEQWVIPAAGFFGLKFSAAPAASVTCAILMHVVEIG
jgi:hypothetical protein